MYLVYALAVVDCGVLKVAVLETKLWRTVLFLRLLQKEVVNMRLMSTHELRLLLIRAVLVGSFE